MNSKLERSDEDRISSLPDELLCHILSFLPTKPAVATSILSTRWRYLSDFVPEIKLDDYGVIKGSLKETNIAKIKFMDFGCKVLQVRLLPRIREIPKFTLHTTTRYDPLFIRDVTLHLYACKIRKLKLQVILRNSARKVLDIIFYCNFLEDLELNAVVQFKVPDSFILPKLKAIKISAFDINGFKFNGGSSIRKLLSGCPILEDLFLSAVSLHEEVKLEICHPLLKRLALVQCSGDYSIIFDTPSLEYLCYISERVYEFEVKNMKSLLHAHISWGSTREQSEQFEREDFDNLSLESLHGTNFINVMHEARSLYLEGSALNALHFSNLPIAKFQKLTILELGCRSVSGWLMLPKLFENTPNLKVLTFYEGFLMYHTPCEEVDYHPPDRTPACFRGNLEEIKTRLFNGYECELELVEYFLKNVEGLKLMMIGAQVSSILPCSDRAPWPVQWPHEEQTPEWLVPTSKRLSAAPRCSEACQIILTWPSPGKYSQQIL